MARHTWIILSLCVLLAACGGGGTGALTLPGGGTGPGGGTPLPGAPALTFQAQADSMDGVPAGATVTFVGDAVTLRGTGFTSATKVFLGLNIELASAEDSLLTTPVADLPATPFVYTDPDDGQQTILEVEATVQLVTSTEIRVTIPASVACHGGFTNPIVRIVGDAGSSTPEDDVLYVVGPKLIGLTPNRGADFGGYSVTIHGDHFSPSTQVAVRFTDPVSGQLRTLGADAATDIAESFVNRNTILVTAWPSIGAGLTQERLADVLLFENVDAIDSAACDALRPESPEAPLQETGVRNTEQADAFTYLPNGVTGFPELFAVTPSSGSELGNNTVVLRGDQFDAFSADLSDPDNPGVGVECPPGSGRFVPARAVTLVDRQTLTVRMPACAVDTAGAAALCVRNKFSIDNPNVRPTAGTDGTCVIVGTFYTVQPVAPVAPPTLASVVTEGDLHDYGLERLFLVGDGFDGQTTVSFLLPGGQTAAARRVIFHNRNLVEVVTDRLPAAVYPLASDVLAGLRIANSAGSADFADRVTFKATPDAGAAPALDGLVENTGPVPGGNRILVLGANFDTTTTVMFGATPATDVRFVDSTALVATVPAATQPGAVDVTVVDDGDASAAVSYEYDSAAGPGCAVVANASQTSGSPDGGYSVLVRGANFTPSTRIDVGGAEGTALFVSDTLLRVVIPAGTAGTSADLSATDPARGCDVALRSIPFGLLAVGDAGPEILAVTASLRTPGGDRFAVSGERFDGNTGFALTQGGGTPVEATGVLVLAPGFAMAVAPAGTAGTADLQAHNAYGDSSVFAVDVAAPDAPTIVDARNVTDGSRQASIEGGGQIALFGADFFGPLTVRLTGCDAADPTQETTVTVAADAITLVDDRLVGVLLPSGTFCEGNLTVEVETPFGSATFEMAGGEAFQLVGPQAPVVEAVFPDKLNSSGGEEVVLVGRFFTATTAFSAGTDGSGFRPVLSTRIVGDTVAVVTMPALPGGLPPAGLPGRIRAEETDPTRAAAIDGDPFTVSGELFSVCREGLGVLLGIFPDHGFIEGGESVLLLGNGFLNALGGTNVTGIRFIDPVLGDVGSYTEADPSDLPLDASDKGKYFVLNDHEILIVTNARPPIPSDLPAPVDVVVASPLGATTLQGGFTYENSPAVRTPMLLAITPNEARLNGGSTHLLSGGFLTEADRIVLVRAADGATRVLSVPADFAEVTDAFLVFPMPDLRGTFAEGDVLDIRAEKDLDDGSVRVSNTLRAVLKVTFAGPPVIQPTLNPAMAGGFGGAVVEITGDFFTTNSQVLFGTMPARAVVFVDPNRILAVVPTLPVDVPDPGLDLSNLHTASGTVDVAVFTQGGWAVEKEGFTFVPQAPVLGGCSPDTVPEGSTVRMTLVGANFVPGLTVVSAQLGTIANVVVESFTQVTFDYTAPSFPRGTLGPKSDSISVQTNQGTAAETCSITILVDPFLDSCTTSYSVNDHASPTVGVEGTSFVEVTLSGGNLVEGGTLSIRTRTGDVVTLTEGELTAPGRFVVVDAQTIRFTPPNRFPANAPNLIDGNPNVGATDITYESPVQRADTLAGCFSYVPSLQDFDDFVFSVPNSGIDVSFPDRIATGDVNADGMPDVVAIARQTSNGAGDGNAEAYVFLSNTFGPLDINGDGQTPDFAGDFTRFVIENDSVRTWLEKDGRGARPLLVNLDGDPQLEIVIPVEGGVLLVDVTAAGALGTQTIVEPAVLGSKARISALAAGNFRGGDGTDLALVSSGKIVLLTSTATPFSFDESSVDIASGLGSPEVYFLESGDFDGDGDDDLIWGLGKGSPGGSGRRNDLPIAVAEINATNGTIVSQKAVTNLTGGRVGTIVTGDLDGDGKDDAVVLVQDEAAGSLLGGTKPGGFAVILDPLGLKADRYVDTIFRQNTSEPYEGSGIYAALVDLNADGASDVAVAGEDGEFQVFYGDGKGGFTEVSRTWAITSRTQEFRSVLRGLAGADLNHDGMAELFVGDVGVTPTNLVLWLNISR